MTYSYKSAGAACRDSLGCVTWLIDMNDMTYSCSYVWHDSFVKACERCVTWLIRMCDVTRWFVWRKSQKILTWLIHYTAREKRDMTHYGLLRNLFICVTWLDHRRAREKRDMRHQDVWRDVNIWDVPREHMWHDSLICVTWVTKVCDMTHSYVWRDSFIKGRGRCVTWLIRMCAVTR